MLPPAEKEVSHEVGAFAIDVGTAGVVLDRALLRQW